MISNSSARTQRIAQILGEEILKTPLGEQALILYLEGDLGGGKTTFIQGLAKGLGIKEKILSPTFVIMKKFAISDKNSKFKNFYHFDCYRVKDENDIIDLGIKEIIGQPENIVAVEWAEKIKNILLGDKIEIKFKWLDKNKREIII